MTEPSEALPFCTCTRLSGGCKPAAGRVCVMPEALPFSEAAREAAARTLARGFDYEHLFDDDGENPDEPYTADYWCHGARQILTAADA